MSNTRKSSRCKAVHINLSNINYDTTCVNILPGGLPVNLACEVCGPKLDIFTKKSSKPNKKERLKHENNRCKQYWSSKWISKQNSTIGHVNRHKLTRSYLHIDHEIVLEYECLKRRKLTKSNSNLISMQNINQTEEDMFSHCTKHLLRPNNGLKEYPDKRKDMLPTDMPDAAGDVVNDPQSRTPCVTGDVADVLPSHTTDVAGDVVNDPQYHTGNELDPTGDVVNDQPSCTVKYDKLWTKISTRELVQLRKDAAVRTEIQKRITSSKRSKLIPLSRRQLGISMLHCPKLSLEIANLRL